MIDLVTHSLTVIKNNQQPDGAYPACPTMPDYQFSWFRDGSFIAYAMMLYGELDSAQRFHRWAARTIARYQAGASRAMTDFRAGKTLQPHDVLRARYTYDGGKGPDDWPEFQLDGLGTWLWALQELRIKGYQLDREVLDAARFVADYLSILWSSPCHDLWEEHGDQIHIYTLGAIYAGLMAAADLFTQYKYRETAQLLNQYMVEYGSHPGHGFIKSVDVDLADGSLIGLAVPYRVRSLHDPIIQATITRIETDLYKPGVGIHRYLGDTYYGGGAWLLLIAWLGWYYTELGKKTKAAEILEGIAKHHIHGDLPEQIAPPMLSTVADYDNWVRMRGPIATPLLWSHAMYLILAHACR